MTLHGIQATITGDVPRDNTLLKGEGLELADVPGLPRLLLGHRGLSRGNHYCYHASDRKHCDRWSHGPNHVSPGHKPAVRQQRSRP